MTTSIASSSKDDAAASTDSYKCPCCNNPWNAAAPSNDDNFFLKKILAVCRACDEGKGLSKRNMDETVLPSNDFYAYANGNWMKTNPIPSGYPNWNSFMSLHLKSQENLRAILEQSEGPEEGEGGDSDSGDAAKEEIDKLRAFYGAAMDEGAVERVGARPLLPLLDLIDEIVDARRCAFSDGGAAMAEKLGTLERRYGIGAFFTTYASPDNKNSSHNLCNVKQGGLVSC